MREFGLVPLFRYFARMQRSRLAIVYILAAVTATALYASGRFNSIPALRLLGFVLGLGSISVFITVTTWYRNDHLPQATFLLSVTTALGYTAGVVAAVLIGGPSTGVDVIVLVGSILGLPVRILILTIIFSVFIAVGRRLRVYFAPQTVLHRKADPASEA